MATLLNTQELNSNLSNQESVPVIDFSSFISSASPEQHLKQVEELGKVCKEWGFFVVINHGIPEKLSNGLFNVGNEIFDLPREKKLHLETNDPSRPVKVTFAAESMYPAISPVPVVRESMRFWVHPDFLCPIEPKDFGNLLSEYTLRIRDIARKLLGGVSQSLGLEENYIDKAVKLDSTAQLFALNCYRPYPEPEKAIGLIPHTDPGLITTLQQNGIGGLQVQHNGKWIDATADVPDAIFVMVGDQLEILSNGTYKGALHRAVLNNKTTRFSLVMSNGPSLDSVVTPAAPLLQSANHGGDGGIPAEYDIPLTFKEIIDQRRGIKRNAGIK